MIKAFNKKVRRHVYQVGDLVIKKIFSGDAIILTTMDGDDLPHPVNTDIVKIYYA